MSLGLGVVVLAAAVSTGPPIQRVVVIHLDSVRADDLGCSGGTARTPAIDAVAARGLVFANAVAVTPDAVPSLATFLTGRYTTRHGVCEVGHALSPDLTTLAEAMRDAGFATAAFTSSPLAGGAGAPSPGFDQGFDVFEIRDEPHPAVPPCQTVTDLALDYVERHRRDRFLLWVMHHDTHAPFTPPAPYDTMYAGDPTLAAADRPLHAARVDYRALLRGVAGTAAYQQRRLGEVTMVDRAVGRLVQRLDELDGTTLLVITADHGLNLGDVGPWFGYGDDIRHGAVNVPLIIAAEGVVPAGVSTALACNADIAPTILDLAGVAALDGASGLSLVPALTDPAPWPQRMIPLQARTGEAWRGVRGGDYCLQSQFVEDTGAYVRSLLYDLRADPRERFDVTADHRDAFDSLFAFERDWFTRPRVVPLSSGARQWRAR